ncbi:hypothetical protein MUO93_11920 [Candidatus Bathyarchaeota archaeon]|nr:hypothetical protein [Candidatus Bathyarchaeota archaeon]
MTESAEDPQRIQRMLEEALKLLEEATGGLRVYRVMVGEILGSSPEEQVETRRLLRGLSPGDVRAALREYRKARLEEAGP